MENKLINTNGLWYKIKRFFKNIFIKNRSNVEYTSSALLNSNSQEKNNFQNNNFKEKIQIEKENQELAEKLLYGEIGASELNDIEVDEMTKHFTNDIKNIDAELFKIKQHILYMKQVIELKNEK